VSAAKASRVAPPYLGVQGFVQPHVAQAQEFNGRFQTLDASKLILVEVLIGQALSQNSVFLANRRWPVEVRVRVCVKLASAMQPIKLVPGKWLGKGNYR